MVDLLIHKEVGDPVNLLAHVAHLLLQATNEGCRRAGGVLFVLIGQSRHLSRPRLRHDELPKQFGEVGDKSFFPNVRLRTAGCRFFGTAIIGVAFLFFGGDHAPALAASEQATKRLRFLVRLLRVSPPLDNLLYLVEQGFADKWRMSAFIYLAAIAEMAVIKRVGKNEFYLVFVERVAMPTFHPVLKEKFGNILIAGVAFCIQLDGGDHRLILFPINNDGLRPHVV